MKSLPESTRNAIQKELHQHRMAGKSVIDIYAMSERVRQAVPDHNVALEDIVEQITNLAGCEFSIEFHPVSAKHALLGNA